MEGADPAWWRISGWQDERCKWLSRSHFDASLTNKSNQRIDRKAVYVARPSADDPGRELTATLQAVLEDERKEGELAERAISGALGRIHAGKTGPSSGEATRLLVA